ncbi:MAG TPA: Mrp/NBP35 family ATP-binding protein [Lentimicrobium sp.]|nr:Mrp/NBP35 family ATP-binding protein [Lentimicrobium sp.]
MNAFEKISLPGVKNIIVVASGKGGVGKSTISSNLAVALARQGYRIALVDADIYGPSVPRMFGIENMKPEVRAEDGREVLTPIEKFGVKIMSIGFFVERNQGLIWRGPMAANAITQLFENTLWGDTDYMIVDFPPGTGDIQLTTVQKLDLHGVVLVTTPQEIALNDARKAASMFTNHELGVPLLGIAENMSWFTPAAHPDEKYYLFGKDGGKKLASELHTRLLGQIPMVAEIGIAAEDGRPVYNISDSSIAEVFDRIAGQLI